VFSLAPDRVIYMGTFTKSLAPSIRMAYMVLPEALLEPYSEKLGFYSCTVPVYDQLVLEAFIREGHLERYIASRRRKMRNVQQG
jgi:GntR family transcriptional regulator/MocR family aminotransferase